MSDNNASSIRVKPVAALTLLLTDAVLIVSADTGAVSLGTLGLTIEDRSMPSKILGVSILTGSSITSSVLSSILTSISTSFILGSLPVLNHTCS